MAFAVLVGLFVASAVLSALLRPINSVLAQMPSVVLSCAVIVLVLGAPFSAQRYRLGHTVWRGIRGGMQGSMIAYGLRSLLYKVAVGLTLAQLLPWASLRLLERRIDASSFGQLRFVSRGRPGRLYVRFLVTFIEVLLLGVVVFGAVVAIDRNARFLTANLLAAGTLDALAFTQNEQRVSRFGEGMFLTLPDGRIVIMRGLIARAGDPDAFAGVVAHEPGHVQHGDPTRETLRHMELNMLARSLGWGGGVASQATALSYGRRAGLLGDGPVFR